MLEIRSAQPADLPAIFDLIQALAAYEQLTDQVTGDVETLEGHLFGDRPYAEAILAETDDRIVGFALFFHNYSTFLTQPGLYLEDLFVLPEYRRQGIGKRLLTYLAQIALSRGCGRLEWSVLDWNQSAIAFYKQLGATVLPDWRICRITSTELNQLAQT